MKIYTLFSLKWKSIIRHPLFEQGLIFQFLLSVYIFSLLALLFISGTFWANNYWQINDYLGVNDYSPLRSTNVIFIFLFLLIPLLCIDFILKFFLKKVSFLFQSLRRFPKSKNSIKRYLFAEELISIWNIYLLIFFYSFLTKNIYPDYGWLITFVSFVTVYFLQLLVSRFVNLIKHRTIDSLSRPTSANLYVSKSSIANHLFLSIKMIRRSPRLLHQFLVYFILTIGYFFIMTTNSEIPGSFPTKLFFLSVIFILFPLTFSQFLFSAEASFFDYLITTPNFKKILPARYILYLTVSFISFFASLFILTFDLNGFIELVAIFLYCIGPITLSSFCGILFANRRYDLFASYSKMLASPPLLQSIVVGVIYVVLVLFVLVVFWLFSAQVATYFMLIVGGVSILLSNHWFNYLYRCFYPNKYEKLEIFRMQ